METFFLVLAISGIAVQALIVLLALFEPGLPYRISDVWEDTCEESPDNTKTKTPLEPWRASGGGIVLRYLFHPELEDEWRP